MIVEIYQKNRFPDAMLTYVIVISRYNSHTWLFVRHRERETWEIPAGHIEQGESAIEAAKRELYEETGALDSGIEPLFDYSARSETQEARYGRVYLAKIGQLGLLPPSEIAEVKFFDRLPDHLTYPEIQTRLWNMALSMIC